MLDQIDPNLLGSLGIILLCSAFTQIVKRAANIPPQDQPLVAIACGIFAGIVVALMRLINADSTPALTLIGNSAFVGLINGLAAVGLWSTGKNSILERNKDKSDSNVVVTESEPDGTPVGDVTPTADH